MKKSILFASVVFISGALAANAAQAESFAGPHVEVTAGGSRENSPLARPGFDAAHRNAFIYGLAAGYDLRFGALVAGLTADIGDSTAHHCRDLNAPSFSQHACYHDSLTFSGGARVGYVIAPSVLVFAAGGYASARQATSFTEVHPDQTLTGKGHDTNGGYRVGGGAELALTQHLYTKIEYRYQSFGERSHQNQVVTAIGYRF